MYIVGRHCCLWCTVTSDKLRIPTAQRADSLSTLSKHHNEFLLDGKNLKKAKFHFNVIEDKFFDIPYHK